MQFSVLFFQLLAATIKAFYW